MRSRTIRCPIEVEPFTRAAASSMLIPFFGCGRAATVSFARAQISFA